MSSNIMYLYLDLWIIKLRMISATSNGNDFFNTDNTVKSDRQFDNKHGFPSSSGKHKSVMSLIFCKIRQVQRVLLPAQKALCTISQAVCKTITPVLCIKFY